jgi:hypothetical protein
MKDQGPIDVMALRAEQERIQASLASEARAQVTAGRAISHAHLAALSGMSQTRLSELVDDGDAPQPDGQGEYAAKDVVPWLVTQEVEL